MEEEIIMGLILNSELILNETILTRCCYTLDNASISRLLGDLQQFGKHHHGIKLELGHALEAVGLFGPYSGSKHILVLVELLKMLC